MHVPKRTFVFQFKSKERKTNFMYLSTHSFSKIKMKMKNKIEVIVNNIFRSEFNSRVLRIIYIYIYILYVTLLNQIISLRISQINYNL